MDDFAKAIAMDFARVSGRRITAADVKDFILETVQNIKMILQGTLTASMQNTCSIAMERRGPVLWERENLLPYIL